MMASHAPDSRRLPGAFPTGNGLINNQNDPNVQPSSTTTPRDGPRSRSIDGNRRSFEQFQAQNPRELARTQNGAARRPSASKICGKCGGSLTGQFVRALEDTFHLECFTCQDCGKIVASKFFPIPDHPPNQYPLCEVDYFRRLNLICYACGGALRGSYITALERKYHIEHFTCSVCPTVFGAQDSYYEHDGNVYCHYHYSTRFAQKCNGCQTAILKQFVEIFRNGQNQHWHPECYMIHKYWNVRLYAPGQFVDERKSIEGNASDEERRRVRREEEKIEEKVLWIWRTLSSYEEKSATCISDMLLHVSNGAYVDGVMSAKKFILHVDLLFAAADSLDQVMLTRSSKGLSYSREAKLLCKKVVAFFQLLAQSQDTGVRRLGVTQELLSLVTGLAHYLKLLIRICLQGSLRLERDDHNEEGLHQFLDHINSLETKLDAEEFTDPSADLALYVKPSADTCPICSTAVEDRCIRHERTIYHLVCFKCSVCQRELISDTESARWNASGRRLICSGCVGDTTNLETGFVVVTRLQQYVHLLRVAHARLLATLRSSGALPHTSDDPNLEKYNSEAGHRITAVDEASGPPGLLRSNTRSKSYAGKTAAEDQEESNASYEQTLGDIRRLRSTRMDKHISNTTKRARTSRIIGGPEGDTAGPESSGNGKPGESKSGFHIITDREVGGEPLSQLTFGNQESITLDDIPRLVAAEQAKDQRPNANRYARGGLVQSDLRPRLVSAHQRSASAANDLEKLGPEGQRPKKYFSELSALEYFIVRHVAVLSMEPLLEGQFNQEELLNLIESRKPTFWGKFGKAFKNDKQKGGRKKGVFKVPLGELVERDSAESTDGVGPGVLKVPALVQDAISAMKTMDMSVEGVFRKNGNIKRLREMAEAIDAKDDEAVDLNSESPVQVAALLKKFFRELPDPVMTYKLHRLFITSQKLVDEEKRRRVLHLACCLLPKSHRDTMEVLFSFLNWAASFSVVDEESGSKMDIHNLATVVAPNILFSNNKVEGMEDSFLAVEAVHSLILYNETMCEVPEDLQSILNDPTLFNNNAEITTKEILKRYGEIAKGTATVTPAGYNNASYAANKQSAELNTPSQQMHTNHDAFNSSPVVHRVNDNDSTWTAEMSVRPVGGPSTSQQHLPQDGIERPFARQNGFYSNSNSGSKDSFGPQGSNGGTVTSPGRYPRPSRDGTSGQQAGVT